MGEKRSEENKMTFTPDQKKLTYTNEKYLNFVRSKPCLICGKGAQAHHESGANVGSGAMGKRVSDLLAIPLCVECHYSRHYHGYITFWLRYYGLSHGVPTNSNYHFRDRLIADGIVMREIIKLQAEWIELDKQP